MSLLLRSPAGTRKPARHAVSFGRTPPEWQWVWGREPLLAVPLWHSGRNVAKRQAPITDTITYEGSSEGQVARFGGSSDLIFGTPPGVSDPLNTFTVVVRFRGASSSDERVRLLDFGGTAVSDPAVALRWDSANHHLTGVRNSIINASDGSAPPDVWHTGALRMTSLSGGLSLWQDGEIVATGSPSDGKAATGNVGIGNNRSGGNDLDGLITVAWFFGDDLSDAEIRALSRDPYGPLR